MLGAVPGDAPVASGRREQPTLLVEADGVDRDVGGPGQVLDPEVSRGLADGHAAIVGAITPTIPPGLLGQVPDGLALLGEGGGPFDGVPAAEDLGRELVGDLPALGLVDLRGPQHELAPDPHRRR